MSAHTESDNLPPLDLSAWRGLPNKLIIGGAVLAVVGAVLNLKQFGYSWLLAFMFFLSLCMGGLALTLFHHLFDASWSVPIRRVNEHLAALAPALAVLFLPIAALAPRLYEWMDLARRHVHDHAVHAKYPLFTIPMFYVVAALCFGVWIFLSTRLRYWSLRQDATGDAACTMKMRGLAYVGIFLFAITLTLAAIMWMKALQHQWFSTMYGVQYFAGSMWVTLATVYVTVTLLKRQGPLREVVREKQFYFLGTLFFAFTVFYAYVSFSQYFIIWNANMPEETFWYLQREKGTWFYLSVLIIFGHFFLPFLAMLRIDVKLKFAIMAPLAGWAWFMHYCDMNFNIMPVLHPEGIPFRWIWLDLGCMALIGGVLAKVFLKNLHAHPVFPQRDPRMAEGLDIYVPSPSAAKQAAH